MQINCVVFNLTEKVSSTDAAAAAAAAAAVNCRCFCIRSLVALSLILSLLLFKPAPLYILDEVDAALDLSHTQNIGQMLKAHFRHSQVLSSSCCVFRPQ